MHQEGFILVFSDILYDGHSPSVGPRGGIPPLGVVMIIVGRELLKTLFFFMYQLVEELFYKSQLILSEYY